MSHNYNLSVCRDEVRVSSCSSPPSGSDDAIQHGQFHRNHKRAATYHNDAGPHDAAKRDLLHCYHYVRD